jgi:hypothetical protein
MKIKKFFVLLVSLIALGVTMPMSDVFAEDSPSSQQEEKAYSVVVRYQQSNGRKDSYTKTQYAYSATEAEDRVRNEFESAYPTRTIISVTATPKK